MSAKHGFMHYVADGVLKEKQMLMEEAKQNGKERAASEYPYAVHRDRASVTRSAEQAFQEWFTSAVELLFVNKAYYQKTVDKNAAEAKRLYTLAWIGGYDEEVARRDEAARPKVQPQPTPQPQPAPQTATPSNTAMLKGATLTLKDVVHNADECVYYVEIEDPGYLDGVLPAEIYSPLEEAPPAQASSGYGIASYGIASSGSSASPSYQSPKKKGTRLYVRNVGKK